MQYYSKMNKLKQSRFEWCFQAEIFWKISTHPLTDENPRVALVLVPGQRGHKQAEKSVQHCSDLDEGERTRLPLADVPLLGSFCLEETNTGFADLGEPQSLFLDFPQRVTEPHSVVHNSINCFKRNPHLQKKPIKLANRHALFRDSCCSNDHVQRITEPQTLSTTSS